MKITALVDRFGSNRMNAELPGQLLRGCSCIAIPFAGSLCEVAWMESNVVNVNDLDRHVMNLCCVVREMRQELIEKLNATPFDPEVLAEAQAKCIEREAASTGICMDLNWAYHYFVASWMTRGGKMGSRGEFDQGMSVRWKSGGGDSVKRFRSATESLAEWQKVMQKCTFHCRDAFDFIGECRKRDVPENGLYCDAPWVGDGKNYVHGQFDELVPWTDDINDKFTPVEMVTRHEVLARMLTSFQQTKIVVRYGDHPLIRELYKQSHWTWCELTSRTQANDDKAEVLLTRNIK